MAQKKGLHLLLEIPLIYNLIQWVFAHKRTNKAWCTLLKDHEDKIIVDIGCGPGNTSIFFKNSKKYIGIDMSEHCIRYAKKNYSKYGEFYCLRIEEIEKLPIKHIDIIILKGVFHHLPDSVIEEFLIKIKSKMSKKSTIFSFDCYLTNKKTLTNLVVSLDRGNFVRSKKGLIDIISNHMCIASQQMIKQTIPPYQRILLAIKAR